MMAGAVASQHPNAEEAAWADRLAEQLRALCGAEYDVGEALTALRVALAEVGGGGGGPLPLRSPVP
jgi:hypothetical protein